VHSLDSAGGMFDELCDKNWWCDTYREAMLFAERVRARLFEYENAIESAESFSGVAGKRIAPSATLRARIFERDGFRCRRCGRAAPEVEIHVDHIVAVSRGGRTEENNLQTLCSPCNVGKSNAKPHMHDFAAVRRPGGGR
jgi:hypothetical protein